MTWVSGQRIGEWGNLQRKAFTLLGASTSYLSQKKNHNSKFQMIFSTAVLLSRYVCSHNKKNGLFNYQIQMAVFAKA